MGIAIIRSKVKPNNQTIKRNRELCFEKTLLRRHESNIISSNHSDPLQRLVKVCHLVLTAIVLIQHENQSKNRKINEYNKNKITILQQRRDEFQGFCFCYSSSRCVNTHEGTSNNDNNCFCLYNDEDYYPN